MGRRRKRGGGGSRWGGTRRTTVKIEKPPPAVIVEAEALSSSSSVVMVDRVISPPSTFFCFLCSTPCRDTLSKGLAQGEVGKAFEKICQNLLIPQMDRSPTNLAACGRCLDAFMEIVQLNRRIGMLEMKVHHTVEGMGQTIIDAERRRQGDVDAVGKQISRNSQLWYHFTQPVIQNYVIGKLPNPYVRLIADPVVNDMPVPENKEVPPTTSTKQGPAGGKKSADIKAQLQQTVRKNAPGAKGLVRTVESEQAESRDRINYLFLGLDEGETPPAPEVPEEVSDSSSSSDSDLDDIFEIKQVEKPKSKSVASRPTTNKLKQSLRQMKDVDESSKDRSSKGQTIVKKASTPAVNQTKKKGKGVPSPSIMRTRKSTGKQQTSTTNQKREPETDTSDDSEVSSDEEDCSVSVQKVTKGKGKRLTTKTVKSSRGRQKDRSPSASSLPDEDGSDTCTRSIKSKPKRSVGLKWKLRNIKKEQDEDEEEEDEKTEDVPPPRKLKIRMILRKPRRSPSPSPPPVIEKTPRKQASAAPKAKTPTATAVDEPLTVTRNKRKRESEATPKLNPRKRANTISSGSTATDLLSKVHSLKDFQVKIQSLPTKTVQEHLLKLEKQKAKASNGDNSKLATESSNHDDDSAPPPKKRGRPKKLSTKSVRNVPPVVMRPKKKVKEDSNDDEEVTVVHVNETEKDVELKSTAGDGDTRTESGQERNAEKSESGNEESAALMPKKNKPGPKSLKLRKGLSCPADKVAKDTLRTESDKAESTESTRSLPEEIKTAESQGESVKVGAGAAVGTKDGKQQAKQRPGPLSKKKGASTTVPQDATLQPPEENKTARQQILKQKPGPLSRKKEVSTTPLEEVEVRQPVEIPIPSRKPGPLSRKKAMEVTDAVVTPNIGLPLQEEWTKDKEPPKQKPKPGPLSRKKAMTKEVVQHEYNNNTSDGRSSNLTPDDEEIIEMISSTSPPLLEGMNYDSSDPFLLNSEMLNLNYSGDLNANKSATDGDDEDYESKSFKFFNSRRASTNPAAISTEESQLNPTPTTSTTMVLSSAATALLRQSTATSAPSSVQISSGFTQALSQAVVSFNSNTNDPGLSQALVRFRHKTPEQVPIDQSLVTSSGDNSLDLPLITIRSDVFSNSPEGLSPPENLLSPSPENYLISAPEPFNALSLINANFNPNDTQNHDNSELSTDQWDDIILGMANNLVPLPPNPDIQQQVDNGAIAGPIAATTPTNNGPFPKANLNSPLLTGSQSNLPIPTARSSGPASTDFICSVCKVPWYNGYDAYLEHLWDHKSPIEKAKAVLVPFALDIPKKTREQLIREGRSPSSFAFSDNLIAELIMYGRFSKATSPPESLCDQGNIENPMAVVPFIPKRRGPLYSVEFIGTGPLALRKLTCNDCEYVATNLCNEDGVKLKEADIALITHYLKHHFQRNHICKTCGQGFSDVPYLEQHMIHHNSSSTK